MLFLARHSKTLLFIAIALSVALIFVSLIWGLELRKQRLAQQRSQSTQQESVEIPQEELEQLRHTFYPRNLPRKLE